VLYNNVCVDMIIIYGEPSIEARVPVQYMTKFELIVVFLLTVLNDA